MPKTRKAMSYKEIQSEPADFRAGLSAVSVHEHLQRSLARMRHAEKCAVLWFREIHARRLHRDLGHSSIHQYATEALGFSPARTSQFIRLAEALDRLPAVRGALAAGEIGWTKAYELIAIATPRSEMHWLAIARTSTRRELRERIAAARARARTVRLVRRRAQATAVVCGRQGTLLDASAAGPGVATSDAGGPGSFGVDGAAPADAASDATRFIGAAHADAAPAATAPAATAPAATAPIATAPNTIQPAVAPSDPVDIPFTLSVRFTPEQHARYEALLEKLHQGRRRRRRTDRAEMILQALEALVAEDDPDGVAIRGSGDGEEDHPVASREPDACLDPNAHEGKRPAPPPTAAGESSPDRSGFRRRKNAPHYLVVIRKCSACNAASVATASGPRLLGRAALAAVECDAMVEGADGRRRSVIPPNVRRAVLARDGHACQAPGCRHTRFLHLHHVVPVSRGGTHRPENLVTLCGACHRLVHERG